MPKLHGRIPSYRLHKASGQAIVTLSNTDHYLGPHGTEVSKAEYDRVVTEWLAAGRRPLMPPQQATSAVSININNLILRFWEHAQIHYRRPDGTHTSELDNFRQALRPLRRLYGHTPAADFGPLALKALREQMISGGWCRRNINNHISRVRSVFRWAAENELVPGSLHQALLTVRGLQRGRTTARESELVRPVAAELIAAVKPFVSRQVWALIQLQQLSAARAGELVLLRGIDLHTGSQAAGCGTAGGQSVGGQTTGGDFSGSAFPGSAFPDSASLSRAFPGLATPSLVPSDGETWSTQPTEHKTAHHGLQRRIYFGPQAVKILCEFIKDRPVHAYLFSPAEAEAERRESLALRRHTPLSCGNKPGSNRKKQPLRQAQEHYTVNSYRRAIERACDLAFPPPEALARQSVVGAKTLNRRRETDSEWKQRLGPENWKKLMQWRKAHRWHPHQLRHNAATQIRREFGIEAARVILGHHSSSVTEVYAEMDEEKARRAIEKIG